MLNSEAKDSALRTIAIINQKGGCGKTTVAINLAATLAAEGQRTLLVDMDPQGHCALGLAVPETQIHHSMADVLLAGLDGSMAIADMVWQISKNFDLAPSNTALAGVEPQLIKAPDKDRRLLQVLSTVQDQYDFCIIDCPPSIGLLTFNALRAANEVIVPVETGYFALQGSFKQEAAVQMLVQRTGHTIRHKILPTMYDVRTRLAREILAELKRHFGENLLPVEIHFNSKLKEAASFGQPITEYDPASRGMQDFEKLSAWLLAHPTTPLLTPMEEHAALDPTLNRAVELAQRAKALSARAAGLTRSITPHITPPPKIEPEAPQTQKPSPESNPTLAKQLQRLFGVRRTTQGMLFVQPDHAGRQVCVAGDFNNWSPTASPLKHDEKLNVWQTCLSIPPGRYRYRLVIDGNWKHDAYNQNIEKNSFGEINSILEVG